MREFFTFISVIALTGCAGAYTSQTYNQLNMASQRELAAWAEVQKRDAEQCPQATPTKPLAKEEAVERMQCYEDLVMAHVMPVAMDVGEVKKLLLAHRRTAIARKQGKIDSEEANLQIQENWINYASTMDAKANAVLNNAAQRDAQLAQQRQQYFQNLSSQINQAQAGNASIDESGIKNTNCQFIANQMQCQSWE